MSQSAVDKYLRNASPQARKWMREGVAPFAISHCGFVDTRFNRSTSREPYRFDCNTESREGNYQH